MDDIALLNRAVYGGDNDLPPEYRYKYDPERDPSDNGIRDDINAYDDYEAYLATFGIQTLGASELGFTTAESGYDDTLLEAGFGPGIDRNWFYEGDLYRNHYQQKDDGTAVPYIDAGAVALAAIKQDGEQKALHLVFRGTDADLGKDGEAGTGPGQVRYYEQLKPLIDKAFALASDPANGITDIVISGHSLGGSMADMFALYDGARFAAIEGVDLQVVALASAGIDPLTLALKPTYDTQIVKTGLGGALTFDTPDWYAQYDNAQDIVRNPERYDVVAHAQTDPAQAPLTRAFTSSLLEHISFEDNRLEVEVPLLDQYAVGSRLATTFLPQHFASLYEMIGREVAGVEPYVSELDYDRVIALGGVNDKLFGTIGSNNVNAFGLPEHNNADYSAESDSIFVLGLSGDDVITSGAGDDLLHGGAGDDEFSTGAGDDIVIGGSGFDRVSYDLAIDAVQIVEIDGGFQVSGVSAGTDLLYEVEAVSFLDAEFSTSGGTGGNDHIDGDNDDDELHGLGGDDELHGRRGDDRLFGGDGDDEIKGQKDHDHLFGGRGHDALKGGSGNDALFGGAGNDLLTGGRGEDLFVFAPSMGDDTIRDLKLLEDRIDLTGWGFASGTTLDDWSAIQDGKDLVLRFAADASLRLEDIDRSDLDNVTFEDVVIL